MCSILVPKSLCEELDAEVCRFWWTGKSRNSHFLELKGWDALCKLRSHGGLGFWRFYDFNLALVSNLTWKLVFRDGAVWATTF